LLVIVSLTGYFKKEIGEYVDKFSPKDLLYMVIFSISVTLIYFFINFVAEKTPIYDLKNTLHPMFYLDDRYLVTKAFEIMFQQTFFMISIYYLFSNKMSKTVDISLFGLYCLIVHLPMLVVGGQMGWVIFFVSYFAGILFSYCITKSKKGFLWSYMIHFGFYVLLAVIFWVGGYNFLLNLN